MHSMSLSISFSFDGDGCGGQLVGNLRRGLINAVLVQGQAGDARRIIGGKADLRIYILAEKAGFTLRENVQIRLSSELHLQMIPRAPDVEEELRRELV